MNLAVQEVALRHVRMVCSRLEIAKRRLTGKVS